MGIQFANETAKLSEYKTATFLEGGEHMISQMEENSFDGTEGLTVRPAKGI